MVNINYASIFNKRPYIFKKIIMEKQILLFWEISLLLDRIYYNLANLIKVLINVNPALNN